MSLEFPLPVWAALMIEGKEQPPRRACFLILKEQPDKLLNLTVDRPLGFDVPDVAKGSRGTIKYFTDETGDDWIVEQEIDRLISGLIVHQLNGDTDGETS